MPFLDLRRSLAKALESAVGQPGATAESLEAEFSIPPNLPLGHVAFPCFKLAKVLRKSPDRIARDLCDALAMPGVTGTVAGSYANFRFDPGALYGRVSAVILGQGPRYGSDPSGVGKKIVLEYCSPNIAKKLAFQHIRSTLIGNTLANVYGFLGYSTERINFIGDWGSQFARLLAAVELWGDQARLEGAENAEAMQHLFEVYVRFHKEVEGNPALLEHASRCLKSLEAGEPSATERWKTIRTISVASMEKTLKRLNVAFDRVEGESHYIPAIAATLEDIKAKAGAKPSEGAWIVEVEGVSTPALIQKRDGTTLYLTRDLAAAIDRFQRFSFEKSFYVVSEQQRLHFQLLFGVLAKMGVPWAGRCEHVSFGTVLFGAEKMSTREGRVIFLDDLLDEARKLALEECTRKNPGLAGKDEIAEMVGVGAVIFGELSVHRMRDLEFNWEQILAFDGETGPYVQYSLVRCRSLLEKARARGDDEGEVATVPELASEEEALVLALSKFRWALHQVVRDNDPYYLAGYLIDLAKVFNRFYYQLPVLQAQDAGTRTLRLSLVRCTARVLETGLGLMGIGCPPEM